jgi:hypothetical protein
VKHEGRRGGRGRNYNKKYMKLEITGKSERHINVGSGKDHLLVKNFSGFADSSF